MTYPANTIDLSLWKINLCTGAPDQIEQPALATYADGNFTCNGKAVTFTVQAGGVVQAGSKYPRTELRETIPGGLAAWSSTTGVHTMTLAGWTTTLAPGKPQAVIGQIHNATRDGVLIYVDGTGKPPGYAVLSVKLYGVDVGTLDPNYKLGSSYVIQIIATGGQLAVWYNGALLVSGVAFADTGLYFKAGLYLQSNITYDSPTAKGVATITGLSVTHV